MLWELTLPGSPIGIVLLMAAQPVICAATCDGLSSTARQGLRTYIQENHIPSDRGTCGDTYLWAHKAVVGDGRAALPCLLDLYANGLTNNRSLWGGQGSPPRACPWALPLIRWIDPDAARPLFEQLRERATSSEARIRIDAELAMLGERSRLPDLIAALAQPAESTDDRYTQSRILMAISRNDYRPAREVIRRYRDRLPDPHIVDVYLAQLDRDRGRLLTCLRDPVTSQAAALALLWMGEGELLRKTSADRTHPSRAMAAAVLEGEIRP